jgi:hypothetical protein
VTGVGPGLSSRRIVVLATATRSTPGLAELSGTAALLELARSSARATEREQRASRRPQLIGRDLRKTLVLVSTSGGSGGARARALGARRDRRPIDGVLVLGDLASRGRQAVGGAVVERARRRRRCSGRRTVEAALRQETGQDAGGARGRRAVGAARGPVHDHGAGRGQPGRPARGAAAGQRGARPGRRRADVARADDPVRPRRAADRDRGRRGRRAQTATGRSSAAPTGS